MHRDKDGNTPLLFRMIYNYIYYAERTIPLELSQYYSESTVELPNKFGNVPYTSFYDPDYLDYLTSINKEELLHKPDINGKVSKDRIAEIYYMFRNDDIYFKWRKYLKI